MKEPEPPPQSGGISGAGFRQTSCNRILERFFLGRMTLVETQTYFIFRFVWSPHNPPFR
jgi:hypothetical protein